MATFRILGSVEAWNGTQRLALGGPLQLRLFAFLVLHANRAVSSDELIDAIWQSERPGADNRLPQAISRLRKTLAPLDLAGKGALRTVAGGYLMKIEPEELDADVFEARVQDGQQALADGQPALALGRLTAGLALWRGPALAEVAFQDFARGEIRRLDERRWDARESRIEAELELGHHRAVVSELEAWLAERPDRERIAAQLMLALYRSGRQPAALETYQRTHAYLNSEFGLESGAALKALQARILAQDPSLMDGTSEDRRERPQASREVGEPGRTNADGAQAQASPISAPLPARLQPYGSRVFVDRGPEADALADVLADVRSTGRRAALVAGEPGIGKTRLVSEFARKAHATGTLVLAGRCDNALDLPYQPFVEALEHLVDNAPIELLESHVAEHGDSIARLVPALGSRATGKPSRGSDRSEPDRYVLFRAIEGLLAAVCERGPLVLVLEDLHWAEIATVSLLRRLLTSPTGPPLMLVGTYRGRELANDHPLRELLADLHREPQVLRLELEGLQTRDVATLVAGLSDGPANSADELLARSLERNTNGNPFFITELVRGLNDNGALVNERGHVRLKADSDLTGQLPISITETLSRRMARIDADVERCLQVGAVFGDEFDINLMSKIGDFGPIGVALDDAVKAGVLIEGGEPGRFRFAHTLFQRYLYGELGAARRAALHGQVALALERALDTGRSSAADVARHWLAAGEPGFEAALQYAARAGDEALEKLAPDEARRWYELALDQIAREQEARNGQRCDLLIGRGEAERQAGDRRFRETLLEAAELARQLDDGPRLVRAALSNTRGMQSATGIVDEKRIATLDAALGVIRDGDTAARARLLAIQAAELMYSEDRERRTALSDEALVRARRLQDPAALSTVLNMRFVTLLAPDTLEERRRNSIEAVSVSEDFDDPLASFYAYHWRGYVGMEAGDLGDARSWLALESVIAERFRRPTTLWLARADEANLAIVAGRLEDARRLAASAFEIGQQGEPDAQACYAAQRACIAFELGRLGALIPDLEQTVDANPGVPAFRATLALALTQGSRLHEARAIVDQAAAAEFEDLPFDVTWLAAVCIYAHVSSVLADVPSAEKLYKLLEPWRDQIVFPAFGVWGPVELYLGALAGVMNEFDAARRHVAQAAQTASRAEAPLWQVRAEGLLSRLSAGG
jgi:DNA-binding SARP family transcriptional activator